MAAAHEHRSLKVSRCEPIYDRAILDQKPQLAHNLTATLLQETCERLIGEAKTFVGRET